MQLSNLNNKPLQNLLDFYKCRKNIIFLISIFGSKYTVYEKRENIPAWLLISEIKSAYSKQFKKDKCSYALKVFIKI